MAWRERIYNVPVKFADQLFSTLVKDQVDQLIHLPEMQQLPSTDEHAQRLLTCRIVELLKLIVCRHIQDSYKVIIQVMTYFKRQEDHLVVINRCLWDAQTDDVLHMEIESDRFKFLIIIHGIRA